MLAGAVTLESLTPQVYRDLSQGAERLRQGINDICQETETPVQVTGLGSLIGVHFTPGPINNYRNIAAGDAELKEHTFLGLLNEGILTAPNVVGALSTATGDPEIDQFLTAFRRVLQRHP